MPVSGLKKHLIQRLEQYDLQSPYILLTYIKEVDIAILLNLDDNSLKNACEINKYTADICSDDYFWFLRIERIYNSNLKKYKGNDTYKNIYKELTKRKGTKLLYYVSTEGYLPLVQYLMENGADIHADYALRLASESGHLEVVKYLVEKGADMHVNNDWALIGASQNGHLELVKYLVEKGANNEY